MGITMNRKGFWILFVFFMTTGFPVWADESGAKPLYVGWASVDITPPEPVALVGQLHKRISQGVRDPLTATALALETCDAEGNREQAILVSCDILYVIRSVQQRIQNEIRARIPGFDPEKLFLNATHTHTGPGYNDAAFHDLYDVSNDPGVMKADDYADIFVEQVTQAAVQAWNNRKRGGMSWALSHAVVGMNRRAHYFDGTSVMYGKVDQENFSHIEGYEDHGVSMLFFWTPEQECTGVLINIACTSQETEGLSVVSADFWHDVRLELRRRLGKDLFVLPQCAAAGDQSPHYLLRAKAEQIMMERRGLDSRQEIARRIVDAVEDGFSLARHDIQSELLFKHTVARFPVPPHSVQAAPFYLTDPVNPLECHILRLGDLAMCTAPFELYLDYGLRVQARSPAILTFVVQLACQHSGYLPTERAVQGGGYSADKFIVGPEGGQRWVEETLKCIKALW